MTESDQPKTKQSRLDLNVEDLPGDPGLRSRVINYNPNGQDHIRRAYLQKRLCQHADHKYSQTIISGKLRHLNPAWFATYRLWLEYSMEKDAAYCLYCYLFKPPDEEGGRDKCCNTKIND